MSRPCRKSPAPSTIGPACLVLPCVLVLAGCSAPSPKPHWHGVPYPEPRRPTLPKAEVPAPAIVAPKPVEPPPAEPPAAGGPETPLAVVALQEDAAMSAQSGELELAATSLERAIRIQPKNPELWHDLARIRLQQEQPGLAEELAKKSTALAKGNAALIRSNWAIIAEARRLVGDDQGAAEASAKAVP